MLFGIAMIDDRLITAFDRLEQALIRLEGRLPERLAERSSPPPATDVAADARYGELEERHAALRARAAAAVERLGALIGPASGISLGER